MGPEVISAFGSAAVSVLGDGFIAENLTIQNTFDLENDQENNARLGRSGVICDGG